MLQTGLMNLFLDGSGQLICGVKNFKPAYSFINNCQSKQRVCLELRFSSKGKVPNRSTYNITYSAHIGRGLAISIVFFSSIDNLWFHYFDTNVEIIY
jgi:hypothetical protein